MKISRLALSLAVLGALILLIVPNPRILRHQWCSATGQGSRQHKCC